MRILHCYKWDLNYLLKNLELINNQGFNAIQIDLDVLSKDDITVLCKEALKFNIKVFADISINKIELETYIRSDERFKDKNYFQIRSMLINNYIEYFGIDIFSSYFKNKLVDKLNALIDCGIMGFKFSNAKLIGLPSEGYDFWNYIIYRLKIYGLFLYGELNFEDSMKIRDEYSTIMNILSNYDCSNLMKMIKYVECSETFLSKNIIGSTSKLTPSTIIDSYNTIVGLYENTLFFARPYDDSWQSEKIREAQIKEKSKILSYKK